MHDGQCGDRPLLVPASVPAKIQRSSRSSVPDGPACSWLPPPCAVLPGCAVDSLPPPSLLSCAAARARGEAPACPHTSPHLRRTPAAPGTHRRSAPHVRRGGAVAFDDEWRMGSSCAHAPSSPTCSTWLPARNVLAQLLRRTRRVVGGVGRGGCGSDPRREGCPGKRSPCWRVRRW
jgi:hypothetical protein